MNPMKALRQYQTVNSHAQISEASPHRLVQMLMEGGLDRLAQAKGALSRGDIAQKGPDDRQGRRYHRWVARRHRSRESQGG